MRRFVRWVTMRTNREWAREALHRERGDQLYEAQIKAAMLSSDLAQRDEDDFAVFLAEQRGRLALHDRPHGGDAKPAGQKPVARGRGAAALDMAEHHDAGLDTDPLLHRRGDRKCPAGGRTFGHDDYRAALAAMPALFDPAAQR